MKNLHELQYLAYLGRLMNNKKKTEKQKTYLAGKKKMQ
jgi:hypothetical protein